MLGNKFLLDITNRVLLHQMRTARRFSFSSLTLLLRFGMSVDMDGGTVYCVILGLDGNAFSRYCQEPDATGGKENAALHRRIAKIRPRF